MKILLATDGSNHSQSALNMLLNFPLPMPCEIKIISIVDTALPITLDLYGGGYLPPINEIEKVARENALRVLENARREIMENFSIDSLIITTEVLLGSPESQIVEAAQKMSADLIIVGSHGYNSWERLLLGSVSDAVVHHASCSVLVARTPKKSL